MHNFDFTKPGTIAEATSALANEDAQAISGGQTLIPTMKQRLAAPSQLVSLTGIEEMQGIQTLSDGGLRIGGATTHADVAASEDYPALSSLAGRIGDPAVRNLGTIGGSLANNDPAACYPAGVLASKATIATDRREIAADDFFSGLFETALEEGEIITEVRLALPKRANYQKFDQPASRFALCAVFVADYGDGEVRVAVTGASSDGVFRWTEAEQALSASFSSEALEGVSLNSDTMISDLFGSAAYRAHIASVLAKRAVSACLA